MSEIFQLSESGVIDVIFAKSGIPSTVTPAPTFELRRVSDNTLMDSGTLTAVGNAYPYTILQAGGALYRLTATTTDAAADYPTFIDEARVGQTWIGYINTSLAAILTAIGNISLAGIPAAVWSYLTTLITTPNSIGTLLLGMNARLNSGTITVVSSVNSRGDLTLIRYQTYSAAINTQIQITVSVPTDPTISGTTVKFSLNFGGGDVRPFAGTVISYSSSAGTATIGLELTDAQTGLMPFGSSWNYSLGIALGSSERGLIPIPFPSGNMNANLTVLDAGAP